MGSTVSSVGLAGSDLTPPNLCLQQTNSINSSNWNQEYNYTHNMNSSNWNQGLVIHYRDLRRGKLHTTKGLPSNRYGMSYSYLESSGEMVPRLNLEIPRPALRESYFLAPRTGVRHTLRVSFSSSDSVGFSFNGMNRSGSLIRLS